jgi:hypothetical protein
MIFDKSVNPDLLIGTFQYLLRYGESSKLFHSGLMCKRINNFFLLLLLSFRDLDEVFQLQRLLE